MGIEEHWNPQPKEPPTSLVAYEEPPKPLALVHEWPVGLAIDVALNSVAVGTAILSDEEICKQYDLELYVYEGIKLHPSFKAEVREHIGSLKDSHAAIKRKARMAFEFYMSQTIPYLLDTDKKVNDDVRLKALMYLGKICGAEAESDAKAAVEASKNTQNAPSINITLTTAAPLVQAPTITIDQTAQRVDNV